AREGNREPEAAGADARRCLLGGGRSPGREDRLRLGAGGDGRGGQRRGRGRRRCPDGAGAPERRDSLGRGRRRHGRRREGDGFHRGHGDVRRDPRGQAEVLLRALPGVVDGRGVGPHRPEAPHRDRGGRGDPV
ncbi:MAG: uncharacterized domain / RidA/YER057c/UK114 superfamily, group 6, partial [uncultured Rubrobacteraceae bacterium]